MLFRFLLAGCIAAQAASAALPLRLVTFNIRYDASSRESNERPWWDLFCGISSDRCRMPHVIKLLSDLASEASAAQDAQGQLGVSLTGDFNSAVGGDAFDALRRTRYMMGEMYDLASAEQHAGTNQLTYTTFTPAAQGSRIDFIWLGTATERSYTVQKYDIEGSVVGSVYISDHRAVVRDVTLV